MGAPEYRCNGCHKKLRKGYRIINCRIWCLECLAKKEGRG